MTLEIESLSDRHLRRWYQDYNRKWFSGDLPEHTDILYAPVQGCLADVGYCPAHDFVLRINPRFAVDTCMVRMTLLHEMVHMKLWPYKIHGKRFQVEMQKLAVLGAFRGLW